MTIPNGHRIETLEQLRAIIPAPEAGSFAIRKQMEALDERCRAVIAAAPFMLLATAGPDGRCDVSPRGDTPGFVHVVDDRTVVIPDRPGNRRLDSLNNILHNPHAATIFLVPNMEEALRVNGRAWISDDPALLSRMSIQGEPPLVGIVIETEEVCFQFARALKLSQLWQTDSWRDRESLPAVAQLLGEQP
ncbi:MAG TPA: MSMEG_1061 family FMN-dependent PPOX-type flavoprotein [Thermomicrobiales bacterium]|nr:MSMEG_1061 family FMN-dependent PPOX-type flavoprotein [Thermomicrobiales bacterium]